MLDSTRLIRVNLLHVPDDGEPEAVAAWVSLTQAMALSMLLARGQMVHGLMHACVELQQAMYVLGWRP